MGFPFRPLVRENSDGHCSPAPVNYCVILAVEFRGVYRVITFRAFRLARQLGWVVQDRSARRRVARQRDLSDRDERKIADRLPLLRGRRVGPATS